MIRQRSTKVDMPLNKEIKPIYTYVYEGHSMNEVIFLEFKSINVTSVLLGIGLLQKLF